jgi:hypothetical protein
MGKSAHSGHCRACKERVCDLLTARYGECRVNVSLPWPARPDEYEHSAIGMSLQRIRAALGDLRGHRDFIKSVQVPPCDFYISNPPLIVEFDESQHFTLPRLVSLSLYPDDFKSGFSVARWQELCRQIDAHDAIPIDRDERRAWYDSLRDLVPAFHGFKPTVRLYAEEIAWCALDSASARDMEFFQLLLQGPAPAAIRAT